MASVGETAALINAGKVDIAEAEGALRNAQEAIQRTQRAFFEAMGDTSPVSLVDAQSALANALPKIDSANRFLAGAAEHADAQIAKLYM